MIESSALEQAYASLEVSRPPDAPTAALAGSGAGTVDNGAHYVKLSFKTATGETLLGAASAVVTVADKSANGKIAVSAIPVGPQGCTDRGVWMTKAGGSTYYRVANIGDNSTVSYTINTADSALTEEEPVRDTAYASLVTAPTSTDAIRHNELTLTAKLNREPSSQKRSTPDVAQSLARRITANWDLGSALWEPSGALGTASYLSPFLRAAFGTRTAPTLNTTVAGGASTTGATLAATTGLTVGDCAIVTVGTAARRELTRIKTLPGGDAVTFDALTASPDSPGKVVSGVNYKLASLVQDTLSIFLFHTGGGKKEAVEGAIVNRVEFIVDGTKEISVKMSGPARKFYRTGFTQPVAHTTAGNPNSGMTGTFDLDGYSFLMISAGVVLENNELLRNVEAGTMYANGHAREKARVVTAACSFYLEDSRLITAADGVTNQVLRLLVGDDDGSMTGLLAPKVEWEIPDIPASEGPKVLSATGRCYATNGNDELYACEA